jgi:hypothetical protein
MARPQKRQQQVGLAPLAMRDAPSFIERQFPVGRLSAEAYKERKAGAGQTLTALGSYWKGRKPLVLVRATDGFCSAGISTNAWRVETAMRCDAPYEMASIPLTPRPDAFAKASLHRSQSTKKPSSSTIPKSVIRNSPKIRAVSNLPPSNFRALAARVLARKRPCDRLPSRPARMSLDTSPSSSSRTRPVFSSPRLLQRELLV